MPAVITDQFRILNASNFIDTVTGIGASDPTNSFYVTLGLPNAEAVGFGRTSNFNDVPTAPIDNICLLYTSPSPRDRQKSRMPSSA